MLDKKNIIIAIDGEAASGKGTLAKKVAQKYNLKYLDTGKIYRAVAYKIINSNIDPNDEESCILVAKNFTISDIDEEHLYGEGIGKIASIVSAIKGVRDALLDFQRNFVKSSVGAVLDGRDIGTVVCPDANFKFFITANLETRAQRRYKQLQNSNKEIIYESILNNLRERDERDKQRLIAPLKKASDAIAIDTTNISVDEALQIILSHINLE